MEKLNGQSMNLIENNIDNLKQLFPEVFTEGKIDFDKLKLVLGDSIEANDERYEFRWNGKNNAVKISQNPSMGTLRPDKQSSKNWDNTENIYIEGDNLEVLKLLQKAYFGKIKMIYIDPPYNTGKDFVYKDNFRDNIANYKEITNQTTKANPETNGRYHTDWLNMMYPRLKLARNLLREDGVIFISIDNNEIHNLRKICDEVMGEENFIEEVIWKNKYGSGAQTKGFIEVHEYILVYSKTPICSITSELDDEGKKSYNKKDEKYETRGGYLTQPLMTRSLGDRENLMYPIYYNGEKIIPNKQWVWSKDRLEKAIANNNVEFNRKDNGEYSVRAKKYLYNDDGSIRRGKPISILNGPFNQEGTKESRSLFEDNIVFDFVKPSNLIKYLISMEINDKSNKDYIVLDFFSGSSTTAHSVMQLNSEDGGKRKFIMVQIPEQTDVKSEAHKAGYKNICEIGKERIRRAGEKVVSDSGKTDLDIGFKVFKLDDSNIKEWDVNYSNLASDDIEEVLKAMKDNIKEGRTKEDLLFEILVKMGIELTAPIQEVEVADKTLFNIGMGSLMVCLEDNITKDIIKEIPKHKSEFIDMKVVFKETGFKTDSDKMNAMQNLKQFGITDVRSV